MEVLCNAVDYGDAPSFVATGIRRVFFVSTHVVRVTFVRRDIGEDGKEELRVSGHIDWDVDEFRAAHATVGEIMSLILAEAPANAEPVLRRIAAH